MRTVRLSGELGKKFGRVHRFLVNSPAEAIRALCANFPDFRKELMTAHERNVGYRVFNGSYELESEKEVGDPASGEIRIVPAYMGANASTRVIIGTVLVAAGAAAYYTGIGAAAAPYLISAGASLVLGGVIEMLSPVPKVQEPDERPENKPSYMFNGPVNTTAQGHPVPIGYGRLRIGGGIVSAGISIDQIMAGYRRVRYDRTTTRNYFMGTDNKLHFITTPNQADEPSNIYRKELKTYTKDGYSLLSNTFDLYVYTLYYYEIVTELVPT